VQIYKTRAFGRFARKERLEDNALREAIERAERGLVDADLGGHVIKQRVGRHGQGRSGGYRTLIAYRSATRAVFLFGFAKNEKDNVNHSELQELRKAAALTLSWSDAEVRALVVAGKWTEIEADG
jgi:hypothetical protein